MMEISQLYLAAVSEEVTSELDIGLTVATDSRVGVGVAVASSLSLPVQAATTKAVAIDRSPKIRTGFILFPLRRPLGWHKAKSILSLMHYAIWRAYTQSPAGYHQPLTPVIYRTS